GDFKSRISPRFPHPAATSTNVISRSFMGTELSLLKHPRPKVVRGESTCEAIRRNRHFLVHGRWAKVHSTRPFHTTKIRIHPDGVEHCWIAQREKNAAPTLRFDSIYPLQTI